MTPEEIKAQLPRTWHPFFGRFGRFTAIQEAVIPRILGGANVVAISPAASGKTEAVVAPVLENLLQAGPLQGLRVLYVSPTRALINDLYRRLEAPVNHLQLELGRKTGDRPQIDPDQLPQVLLTTPESFDSLLCRRPRIFQDLQYVILDEVHLLDNTPRGDQLRVLLARLRKIRSGLKYAALSATIEDKQLGARYFPDPEACLLNDPREIRFNLMPAHRFVERLFAVLRDKGYAKVLAFFNARSLVEGFSQKMNRPPFAGRVLVHHASLPKTRREETERLMNESRRAFLLATSTLELGIDIGDIDCIILYRPPYNVSSLLQRIGRGNRRSGTLTAIGVYTSEWEKILFETFFACARDGRLFEKQYHPALSVVPQQIYSYLYQRRRIGTTLASLNQVLAPVYDETDVRTVFRHCCAAGSVRETRPGIYQLSDRLESKIRYGKIHSTIAEKSFGEYDVIDAEHGTRVGRVFYLFERFILGGRCWLRLRVDEKEKKVYARYLSAGPDFSKVFEGKGAGNYNYRLAPVLIRRFFPDLPETAVPCRRDGKAHHIFHLFGSLYGFILADAFFLDGIESLDMDGKILTLHGWPQEGDRFPKPGPDAIQQVIRGNIARLEDALGSGSQLYDLPEDQQVQDHYRGLDLAGFLDYLDTLRLVEVGPEKFERAVKAAGS